jgi:hypothetical protein
MNLVKTKQVRKLASGKAHPVPNRLEKLELFSIDPEAEASQTIIPVTSLPNRIPTVPLQEQKSALSQEWHDLVVRVYTA